MSSTILFLKRFYSAWQQKRLLSILLLSTALILSNTSYAQDNNLPGKGITVTPIKSSLAEETFQTELVMRALEKLGYDVKPMKIAEYNLIFQALANGDVTFMADGWFPMHDTFYKGVDGDKTLYRQGVYIDNGIQGYLIDKATAEKYNITNIAQLKDPKIAQLFDSNGDGKADLTGCTPGWFCQEVIDHHLKVYQLQDTVTHNTGSYSAMIANTIARYHEGKPILYYGWTPYWLIDILTPGKNVVWLEVPFSSLPGDQTNSNTKLANGKNYGFPVNTQNIVANRKFAEENPTAAKLFAIMKIPASDVSAQNLRMRNGENSPQDIKRHIDGWIKAHQTTFDDWIQQALEAPK